MNTHTHTHTHTFIQSIYMQHFLYSTSLTHCHSHTHTAVRGFSILHKATAARGMGETVRSTSWATATILLWHSTSTVVPNAHWMTAMHLDLNPSDNHCLTLDSIGLVPSSTVRNLEFCCLTGACHLTHTYKSLSMLLLLLDWIIVIVYYQDVPVNLWKPHNLFPSLGLWLTPCVLRLGLNQAKSNFWKICVYFPESEKYLKSCSWCYFNRWKTLFVSKVMMSVWHWRIFLIPFPLPADIISVCPLCTRGVWLFINIGKDRQKRAVISDMIKSKRWGSAALREIIPDMAKGLLKLTDEIQGISFCLFSSIIVYILFKSIFSKCELWIKWGFVWCTVSRKIKKQREQGMKLFQGEDEEGAV